MIYLGLFILLIVLVSASYGVWLNRKLHFRHEDFVTPFGFFLLMTLVQLVCYPAMYFNLPAHYEHLMISLVLLVGIGYALGHTREIAEEFLQKKVLWVLGALIVFVAVFWRCGCDITYSDAQMYLNYMSQNINAPQINLFNIWTGKVGQEWDTIYLFQGYYHFGSYAAWLINCSHYLQGSAMNLDNIVIETWGLGILYSLMSSMLLVDFVHYFGLEKKKEAIVLTFGLFYENFFYWRVAYSFYGNTFRTITTCALIYCLIRYFKEENIDFKKLSVIVSFAGLSFSSSYLFISFAVYYALMVILFQNKRRNAIREMADFVFPLLVYALSCFSRDNIPLFWVGLVLAALYYSLRNTTGLLKVTDRIEGFLYQRSEKVFLWGMFVLMAVGGAIYYFAFNPNYEYAYASYFDNHQNYDMIKDFFFLYTGKSQNLVNILRWAGVILLFTDKREDKGISYLKKLFLILFVIFLNPFTTIAIAKLIASNVYYRTFDVVFNPLTECLFLALVLERFDRKWVTVGSAVFVAYMLVYTHGVSLINEYSGEYGYVLHQEVLPKYKITNDELQAIRALQKEIDGQKKEDQWKIISHANGLRTFEPEVWQLFTTREYWYAQDRLTEEFFQQARDHDGYVSYPETDFSSACMYLNRFDADYLIINFHNNPDYDIEVAKCSERVYENETFRLYHFQGAEQ
ncbi:MAG: hypothetical protein IKE21_01785 [Erysipelotrichaceae bacterium]|nr:hypothetical protein [Erysipelotrichaceae bacterium]